LFDNFKIYSFIWRIRQYRDEKMVDGHLAGVSMTGYGFYGS